MRPRLRVGIQPGTKALRLERFSAFWALWINAAPDFSQGSLLRLYNDGAVEYVTIHADGTESVLRTKEADGA